MPNAAAGDSIARGGKAGGGKGGAGNSGGKGGGSRPRQGDWACFLCGFQSNRDFRGRCWNCEGLRNPSMEQTFGTYAQRQVQQQRQAQGQQQRQAKRSGGGGNGGSPTSTECKELRDKLEKLQAELAATKAMAARGGGAAVEEEEDEVMEDEGECDYAAWTEEERSKRLELARGGLAYAAACYGDESPQAAELRETIASLQKASREAKPFKAHRNLLERRREELRRRQERDEAAISKVQSEMEELQTKLGGLKAAVEERAKAIASVTDELNDLVLKTLAEEGGGGGEDRRMPSAQQGTPWAAVSAALQPLAGQAGIPAEVAALLVQVQQACAKAAATSTPQQAATRLPTDESPSPAVGVAADFQAGALAPQWRRGKVAARSSPSPQRPQPPNPTAAAAAAAPATGTAAAAGGNAQQGGGGTDGDGTTTGPCPTTNPADDGAAAAAAAAGAAAAAATATSAGVARTNGGASDDELLEEVDGNAMQIDLEESISTLPDRVQRRLRAALRAGGGGGQAAGSSGEGAGAEAGSRRQERERSPRPTKAGDKDL